MKLTFIIGGVALFMLIASAIAQARRGIGRWSLVPWDYAMILSAIILLATAAHLALLWRDLPA